MSRDMREEPALAALDDATLAVRTLIGASQDLTARMARAMGINLTDMTAILLLTERGPMGATELAGRLGIRLASTTVLVDRLEQAGHVERVRDTVDRRRVTVTETAAARAASLSAWLPAIKQIDDVCRSLSDTERQFTLDLLARLTAAMERGGRS